MPPKARPLESWYRVEPDGCWNWLGTINDGYGQLSINRNGKVTTKKAHILMYEKVYGPVPEGKQLDHLCRNRRCCNPDHVEPVSNSVNVRRGLSPKLTIEKAREIRERYTAGRISQLALAYEYGVSERAVNFVVHGGTWLEGSEDHKIIGRQKQGRKNILNPQQLEELVTRLRAGERNGVLAREFGISPASVTRIRKEKELQCPL